MPLVKKYDLITAVSGRNTEHVSVGGFPWTQVHLLSASGWLFEFEGSIQWGATTPRYVKLPAFKGDGTFVPADSTITAAQDAVYWVYTGGSDRLFLNTSLLTSGTWACMPALDGPPFGLLRTQATGGSTPYFAIPAGSGDGDAAVIKASAGTVYGIQLGNIQSVPVYFKLYDKSTTPTSGDTPVKVIEVPANATAALGAGNNVPIPSQGIAFANGISWRIVTGIANNDSTEVSANNQVINVDYA